MKRGREIDRIFIDEASNISDKQFKDIAKMMRGSIFRRTLNWFKKLLGIKTGWYYLGVDFSKGEITTCSTRMSKEGFVFVEEIKTEKSK